MKDDVKCCLWFRIWILVVLPTAALPLSCAGVSWGGAEREGSLREADATFLEGLVPEGVGWFCHDYDFGHVIARDASGAETLDADDHRYGGMCRRTQAGCVASREKTLGAFKGQRNGLHRISQCLPQARAVCFHYFSGISDSTDISCVPSTSICKETVRIMKVTADGVTSNADLSNFSACTYVD